MSELGLDFARIMFELAEHPVSVKFTENFPGFEFGGVKLPATPKNSRIDIPYYIAEIFFQENLIDDFTESFPLSLQDLTTAVRKEVRQGELQSLHPFYYALLNKHLSSNKAENSHFNEIELKRQLARLKQLTLERLSKIIKFAEDDNFNPEKSNLTASEVVLMQKIHSWVSSWKTLVNKQ